MLITLPHKDEALLAELRAPLVCEFCGRRVRRLEVHHLGRNGA